MDITDPRELLMALGQKMLDLTYEITILGEDVERDRERVRLHLIDLGLVKDGEVMAEIARDTPAPEGMSLIDFAQKSFRYMQAQSERHHATIEYVAMRRALEFVPMDMDAALAAMMSAASDAVEGNEEDK